jgi:type III restriction enzyme
MSTMLKLMFLKDFGTPDKKILSLNKNEYYAFIINNEDKLKEDLKSANSQLAKQMSLQLQAVTKQFNIPEVEYIKFDPYTRAIEELESSAYENYTEQTLVDGLRSNSEKLFERYCENNKKIDWVYKNGDSGQQYFSIVYYNSFGKQILFYPDYILKLKNGETYIIETKGGEYSDGTSKNIDTNVLNKFEAFKLYANNNNIKWSFVRDLEQKLYFNNTEYVDSLSDKKRWKSIEELFKQ